MKTQHLVVVGNGMAGMRTVENLLRLAPDYYRITVIGSEPRGNYNRILLSPVLAGEKSFADTLMHDLDWYAANDITLHAGVSVTTIDRAARRIHCSNGLNLDYDRLLLATGSAPFMPPVSGVELPGVLGFRDLDDVETMLTAAREHRHAVVIGGGILGLEAAAALLQRGMNVTVVHRNAWLMDKQLDETAGRMLQTALEMRGIRFVLNARTEALEGNARVQSVRIGFTPSPLVGKAPSGTALDRTANPQGVGQESPTSKGRGEGAASIESSATFNARTPSPIKGEGAKTPSQTLSADLVVITAGVRPRIELARDCGLACHAGIVVDDTLTTSDPAICAVGECIEHRSETFGLVAPLWEQAEILARRLAGDDTALYHGSPPQTTRLKVSGIEVFSAGEFHASADCDVLTLHDPIDRHYRRLVLRDNRLIGAVLYGDTADGSWYFDLLKKGESRANVMLQPGDVIIIPESMF